MPSDRQEASSAATTVRERYDFFDVRRDRGEPFDEGDVQNVHAWMRAVTEWVEATDERLGNVAATASRARRDSFGMRTLG